LDALGLSPDMVLGSSGGARVGGDLGFGAGGGGELQGAARHLLGFMVAARVSGWMAQGGGWVWWCRAEVAQGGGCWIGRSVVLFTSYSTIREQYHWSCNVLRRSQDQGLSTKMLGLGFTAQR
jgi:hypothetical protein